MIKKNLFFYISIIGLATIPLPCYAMWVFDYVPVETVCNFALASINNSQQPVQWDEPFFTGQLKSQNYSLIMPRIYALMDDINKNTLVCEWIQQYADEGYVPMMYLFLRDKNRALINKVGIGKDNWKAIGKYLLLSFICVYQDETYCRNSKCERLQDNGMLTNSWCGGERYQRDIILIFRTKYAQWFGAGDFLLENFVKFKDALDAAKEWFSNHSNKQQHPIWIKYCYEKWPSKTKQIMFDTPHTQTKFNSEKRKRYYNEVLSSLEKMGSWFSFFSPQPNQNRQQEQEDSYENDDK